MMEFKAIEETGEGFGTIKRFFKYTGIRTHVGLHAMLPAAAGS